MKKIVYNNSQNKSFLLIERNTLEICLLKVNLLSIVTPKILNSFTTSNLKPGNATFQPICSFLFSAC
ncbi:hypothetical protein BpHYR1_002627 [Brachionus plicatilis]|uniref:Uncharacterized protein n=1 Tax=Brachionus plicatilis TaxID=10195 RepID=A0A3M7SEW1_BRAPC|nr:hypothetical protein BpHYR1_002627 [Brachionus plicatilis]